MPPRRTDSEQQTINAEVATSREAMRHAAEQGRASAEDGRVEAEAWRNETENDRLHAEERREAAENARASADDARGAEQSRDLTELDELKRRVAQLEKLFAEFQGRTGTARGNGLAADGIAQEPAARKT